MAAISLRLNNCLYKICFNMSLWTILLGLTGVTGHTVYTGPNLCSIIENDAELYCNYSTTGDPRITWYIGDTVGTGDQVIRLDSNGVHPRSGFDRHWVLPPAILTINDTEFEDTGRYWCELSGAGVDRKEDFIELTVLEAHSVNLTSPVDESTHDESVEVVLTCIHTGYDVSGISWEKDDVPIDVQSERYTISDDYSVLSILDTTRDDAGNYSCIVSNCAGINPSTPSELIVNFPATINGKHNGARSVEYKNSLVTLIVNADGVPTPNYTWWNKAGLLEDQTSYRMEARVNTDYGEVTCKVCNEFSCVDEMFTLNILLIEEWLFIFLMTLTAVVFVSACLAVAYGIYVYTVKGKK